jgi:hypothetical protein
MTTRATNRAVAALFVIWLMLVGAGLGGLWIYAATPGPAATASDTWPSASRVQRDARRPTLVMFAHPQCACSSASIGELSLLMTHAQGRVSTKVLFYHPTDAADAWTHSDLWYAAAAIPGVEVIADDNGHEAAIFGALVSGQTLLYDADGRLTFSGGITGARGHSGDNLGRSTLVSLLLTGRAATAKTPVFGCFLRDAPANESPMARPQGKS